MLIFSANPALNDGMPILYYNNSSSSLKQPNMASAPLLCVLGGRVYVNVGFVMSPTREEALCSPYQLFVVVLKK